MASTQILALDLATKTGWAHSCGASGVQDFSPRRGDSPGMRWLAFRAWLTLENEANAQLIAAAPTLLTIATDLHAENERLREALSNLAQESEHLDGRMSEEKRVSCIHVGAWRMRVREARAALTGRAKG